MNSNDKFLNKIEVLTNIFTVDKGNLKILLLKNNAEPYKGYWMLPRYILDNTENVIDCGNMLIQNMLGLKGVELEQDNVYSDIDRINDERVIGISLIGLIDSITVNFNREEIEGIESKWFEIDTIPKTIYDHTDIIKNAVASLENKIVCGRSLKRLFPSDFTLPELQKVYEQILNVELDRRNFRKKIMNLDIIEPTGDKNIGSNGRPANLYRFKDNIEQTKLF